MSTQEDGSNTGATDTGADDGGADDFDLPLTDDTGYTSKDDDDGEPIVAAKPKAPEPAKEEEPKVDKLAELAKKRAERSAKLAIERDRRELESRTKELEQKASKFDRFEDLKGKGKKLEALREAGFELAELIDEHMETMGVAAENGEAPTPGDKAMAERLAKLEAKLAEKEAAEKARENEEKVSKEEAERNRRLNSAVEEVRKVLGAEADRYEVINALDEHEEAFRQFGAWCRKHQVIFGDEDEDEARETFKAFADDFEERLAARVAKAAGAKKISARIGRPAAEARTAVRTATAKTAPARTGRVAPPVETEDDFAEVLDPRKRARLLGRSISLTE